MQKKQALSTKTTTMNNEDDLHNFTHQETRSWLTKGNGSIEDDLKAFFASESTPENPAKKISSWAEFLNHCTNLSQDNTIKRLPINYDPVDTSEPDAIADEEAAVQSERMTHRG